MLDKQENLSDMAEALTVKKDIPVNKSKDESSFVAKEIAAREEAEKKNNKSELFDDGDHKRRTGSSGYSRRLQH